MDITYGEEISLDAVAPLFAHSKASTSTPPTTALSAHQPHASTSSKLTINTQDEEMEEGELLEEGEISEESSDESELVASTLIAPAYNPKTRNATSLPPVSFPKQDLSLRIAPSLLTSSTTFPLPSSTSNLPPRPQPIPTSSSTPSSTSKPPPIKNEPSIIPGSIQEYEKLTDELYSYGVTCDYLIGKGVTKDLVVNTFAQRGYKLPQHHLNRHLERQQQWREHQAGLVGQQAPTSLHQQQVPNRQQPSEQPEPALPERQISQPQKATLPHDPSISLPSTSNIPQSNIKTHNRSISYLSDSSLLRMGALLPAPPSSAPSSTSIPTSTKRRRESQDITSSVPSSVALPAAPTTSSSSADKLTSDLQALKEELARKEANAREALRARKAALAKQNAQRAEHFIEGLLSASSAVEVPAVQAATVASSAPAQTMSQDIHPVASTSQATLQPVSDLEDYEEGEEVEVAASPPLPPPLPTTTTSSASLSTNRPLPPQRSSSTTSFNQTSRFNRPKATDFEADPSHSLPNVPRWTEQLLESQRRLADASEMVIDLSDSEEEDDDGNDEGGEEQENPSSSASRMHEQLRQAVKDSKMQDINASSSSYNGYYQNTFTPYSSYSLHNPVKAPESARLSPAPVTVSTQARRRVSPTASTSRGSTPLLSTNRSIISTPASTPASAPATSTGGGSRNGNGSGNAELEAKQAEIKKMMEMIAKMESSKKKKQKATNASAAIAMQRTTSTSSTPASRETSAAPAPAALLDEKAQNEEETPQIESVNVVLEAAKEKVEQLLDEQEQLVLATSSNENQVGQLHRDAQKDDENASENRLPVPSSMLRRGSSSDEAMSISSGDE